MATLPHTAPATLRQPTLTCCCRSETIRRGEVRPVYHDSEWLVLPTARDGGRGWHLAILKIDDTVYRAESFIADDGEGRAWEIVDLRQGDGTHYRLTFGQGEETCDCPAAMFRPAAVCKHRAAVRRALDWLAERERAAWEAQVAAAHLERFSGVVMPPF